MAIESVRVNGRVEKIRFPDDWSEDQIREGIYRFYQQEVGKPSDVPSMPPEGASFPPSLEKPKYQQFMEDVPRMVGGIAGPIAAASRGVGAAGQVASAGLGGAFGESITQLWKSLTGSENAPKDALEAAKRVGMAGTETAAYEALGQTVFGLAKGVYNAARPVITPAMRPIQEQMRSYGSSLLPDQATQSKLWDGIQGFVEAGYFGKEFLNQAREGQITAVKRMSEDLVGRLIPAVNNLSSSERGTLFVDTIKGGETAFKGISNDLYENVDRLVAERLVQKTVPTVQSSAILDASGNPLQRVVQTTVTELVDNAPVNMIPVKKEALKILERLEKTGNLAGQERERILSVLASRPDSVPFSIANEIRGDLLSVIRSLDNKIGVDRAKATSSKFADEITKAMDSAISSSRVPELNAAYQAANTFYREGKEVFNSDLIVGLLKTDPEFIGKSVFRNGSVTDIIDTKKALQRMQRYDSSIDAEKVWGQMQAGYVESLLQKGGRESGLPSVSSLRKVIHDEETRRTFQTALTRDQQRAFTNFVEVYDIVSKRKSKGLGTMALQLGQGAGLIALASFPVSGDIPSATTGAAVVLTPFMIGRAMTKPDFLQKITRAMVTQADSTAGKKLVTQLYPELIKLQIEEQTSER